jgi:hypothetical protein
LFQVRIPAFGFGDPVVAVRILQDVVEAVARLPSFVSDRRMVDPDDPQRWSWRELIKYFTKGIEGYTRHLHDMGWLPLFDGFLLDSHHSIA